MKSQTPYFASRLLALATMTLVIGCHREEPPDLADHTPSKSDVAPPSVHVPDETSEYNSYIPDAEDKISDPVNLWTTLESFLDDYRQLSNEQFVEATHELLRLRSEVSERRNLNSLVIASKIEDIISYEIARRSASGSLPMDMANQLAGVLQPAVFGKSELADLIGYSSQQRSKKRGAPLRINELRDFALTQTGGEEGVLDELQKISEPKDIVAVESLKPIFKFSAIINARRHVSALQAYLTFRERGGDNAIQPLYKSLHEVIPDILSDPVIISDGLVDEPLTTGDIGRILPQIEFKGKGK